MHQKQPPANVARSIFIPPLIESAYRVQNGCHRSANLTKPPERSFRLLTAFHSNRVRFLPLSDESSSISEQRPSHSSLSTPLSAKSANDRLRLMIDGAVRFHLLTLPAQM